MQVFKLVTMCLWSITEPIFANRFSEETAKSFANNFREVNQVGTGSYICEASYQEVFGFFK
jgi:hypothetical protein